MKKTIISVSILFFAAFTAFGQSITLSANSSLNQVLVRGYGSNVPNFSGLRSLGTPTAPTAVLANTPLAVIYGDGYNGSAFSNNGALIALTANENFTSIANGTNIEFFTTNNGTTNPAKRMTLSHNGRVGIGTDNPQSLLEVKTQTANYGVQHTDGTVTVSTYINNTTGGWLGTRSNHPLSLFVNNGNASLQVNTAGNTSIGKLATHLYKLEVHPTGEYGIGLFNSNDTHRWEFFVEPNGAGITGGDLALWADGSSKGFFDRITGIYTTSSDRRLKKNIVPLENVLDKVMQLNPCNYQFIANNPNGVISTGFIAQEVEPLFPQFVGTGVDKNGKETKTMDYSGMSVIAIKAIQEQQDLIVGLQATFDKLQSENLVMKKENKAIENRLTSIENILSKNSGSKK